MEFVTDFLCLEMDGHLGDKPIVSGLCDTADTDGNVTMDGLLIIGGTGGLLERDGEGGLLGAAGVESLLKVTRLHCLLCSDEVGDLKECIRTGESGGGVL